MTDHQLNRINHAPCGPAVRVQDRTLRSPGVVLPSIEHTGEDEMRRRVLEAVAPFRAEDGSYRLVNELTHVIARKPA